MILLVRGGGGRDPENAVEVEGPDGVTETGLVLLPFQGWDAQSDHAVFRVETRDGRRAIVRYELTLPTPGTAAAQ